MWGDDPPRRVRRLEKIGVHVTGYVARIQDFLAPATVVVCPMRSVGMQFQVPEAMASCAPVAANPDALGGTEVIDGVHLLMVNDAGDLCRVSSALA